MITYSFYADDDKRRHSYLIDVQDDICLEIRLPQSHWL